MNWFLAAVGAGALWWGLRDRSDSSTVRVEALSGATKLVNVSGRRYVVERLGGGNFSVASVESPGVFVTFGQDLATKGPTTSGGDVTQLRADMARFPAELFT